ncbi:MAG: hypothetical protein ACR2RB_22635 [Gammaproteobacteria bacterium]
MSSNAHQLMWLSPLVGFAVFTATLRVLWSTLCDTPGGEAELRYGLH